MPERDLRKALTFLTGMERKAAYLAATRAEGNCYRTVTFTLTLRFGSESACQDVA
jgi:hypothetical protein